MVSTHTNQNQPPLAAILQRFAGVDPQYVDLSEKAAAACLGLQPKTLEDWRRRGTGPQFLKVGRGVKYKLSTILAYRDSCTFNSSREARSFRPSRRQQHDGDAA